MQQLQHLCGASPAGQVLQARLLAKAAPGVGSAAAGLRPLLALHRELPAVVAPALSEAAEGWQSRSGLQGCSFSGQGKKLGQRWAA
jgi:hypothetical protein